jgi:PqqD family protein of HPr-rel-A system
VQAAVKWQVVPADLVYWREWDGENVVYNDRTGNTHLLDRLAGLVLRRLTESDAARSVAELAESIGQSEAIEPDAVLIEAVQVVLTDLERIGLVARGTA